MSDLIREYGDFVDELRTEYVSRGFSVISPDEISSKLGFRPDLVVAHNGEITVIEVKATDRTPLRELTTCVNAPSGLATGLS